MVWYWKPELFGVGVVHIRADALMGGVSLGRASHQEGGTRVPRSPTPAWLQGPSPGKVLPAAGGTCAGPQAWLPGTPGWLRTWLELSVTGSSRSGTQEALRALLPHWPLAWVSTWQGTHKGRCCFRKASVLACPVAGCLPSGDVCLPAGFS